MLGKEIFIRICDRGDSPWERISFDDFRFHETKPDFLPSYARANSVPTGTTSDVLKLIDTERDSRLGLWHWAERKRILASSWGDRMLQLPVAVPNEYDLAFTLEGSPGIHDVGVVLPVGDRQVILLIDGGGKSASGLTLVDGKLWNDNASTHRGAVLLDGKPNELVCQVRADSVKLSCNGATVIDWHGDPRRLSLEFGKVASWDGLCIGGFRAAYRVSKLDFTPISPQRAGGNEKSNKARSAVPSARSNAENSDGWVPLFNGKDLTGWKTHPSQPGNWRVENGVLRGSRAATSYLYSERDRYQDFELHVEARINDSGSGGVYFRSPFGPIWPPENPVLPQGYKAQIDGTKRDYYKTASIFDGSEQAVFNVHDPLVTPGQWFTMDLVATDNHLVVKINGSVAADYTDEMRQFASGHLALAKHDPQTTVEFRAIEIKDLPPRATAPAAGKVVADSSPVIRGHMGRLTGVGFTPDGETLITSANNQTRCLEKGVFMNNAGPDNAVRFWDAASGKQRFALTRDLGQNWQPPVQGFSISPDDRSIAVSAGRASSDWGNHTVTVWNLARPERMNYFPLAGWNGVWTPFFSRDGQTLFAFRSDQTVHVLNVSKRMEEKQFLLGGQADKGALRSVCMTYDRDRVVAGYRDGTIRIWSIENGQLLGELKGHTAFIQAVALSPDEKTLASASFDGTSRLWSLSNQQQLRSIDHDGARVFSVLFLGDGDKVVTGSDKNAAVVYEASSGKELCRFVGHVGPVTSLAISPDGKYLATGSNDKTARIWAIPEAIRGSLSLSATTPANTGRGDKPPIKPASKTTKSASGSPTRAVPQDGFIPLLNGRDLRAWLFPKRAGGSKFDQGVIRLTRNDDYFFTKRSNFKDFTLRLEMSASQGTEAMVGIRQQGAGTAGTAITSRIFDDGTSIRAGMQWLNFAPTAEIGTKRASIPYDQFFTLELRIKGQYATVTIDGAETSNNIHHPGGKPEGALGVVVRKGKLAIRKVEVKEVP